MPAHCATKFDPPRSRPQHLLRRRQLAAIDPHARLLLVCASAGYGKTTLLRQWIARDAGRPTAWIQLAPEDDGLFAFWIAVVSGIAGACPQVGRRSLGALAGPFVDVQHDVLVPLVDDLGAHGVALDLVLDDLHLVSDAAAHGTLAWLVEKAPADVRIAIATRHAPGLPLGRLRARGDLTELRAADLRFDDGEARCLLNERLGRDLSPDELAALVRRTEGWPAGLYLAALSLRAVDASAARLPAPSSRALTISSDGCEPLSERELEVLRLLGGTLSLPGDRRRAVRRPQHGEDAHARDLPQARHRQPRRGRGARAQAAAVVSAPGTPITPRDHRGRCSPPRARWRRGRR